MSLYILTNDLCKTRKSIVKSSVKFLLSFDHAIRHAVQ